MTELEQAANYGKEIMEQIDARAKQKKEEVRDFFNLMQDEMNDGESPQNELEHFITACDDLMEEV